MLRRQDEPTLVELVFQVDQPAVQEALACAGHPARGRAGDHYQEDVGRKERLQDQRGDLSASAVRTVASWLIDIHGQHEHQSLLTTGNHLKYLDAYGDGELKGPKELLAEAWNLYREKKSRLEETGTDREQRARELSFLQFEIDEIEKAELTPGEDEQLEAGI